MRWNDRAALVQVQGRLRRERARGGRAGATALFIACILSLCGARSLSRLVESYGLHTVLKVRTLPKVCSVPFLHGERSLSCLVLVEPDRLQAVLKVRSVLKVLTFLHGDRKDTLEQMLQTPGVAPTPLHSLSHPHTHCLSPTHTTQHTNHCQIMVPEPPTAPRREACAPQVL